MNTYQKYIESIEDDEPQYVVDLVGTLHDLSGDLGSKLNSVDKSIEYWRTKLQEDPRSSSANKFFKNFLHLKEQILLYIEGKDIVAHI